jgi:hypothetical protein
MKCDIGHFEIKAGGRCYNLTPSFENIMKLGDGKDLIDIYNVLHGLGELSERVDVLKDFYMYTIELAAKVIRACCDTDPSAVLVDVIDRNGKYKIKIGTGARVTAEEQIIIAAGLARHGISGVSKKPKKNDGKSKPAEEIELWDYVHILMGEKFRMSRKDALSMTMTEFVRLWDINNPEQKTAADDISDDEYDEAMTRMNKQRLARGEKEWLNPQVV